MNDEEIRKHIYIYLKGYKSHTETTLAQWFRSREICLSSKKAKTMMNVIERGSR